MNKRDTDVSCVVDTFYCLSSPHLSLVSLGFLPFIPVTGGVRRPLIFMGILLFLCYGYLLLIGWLRLCLLCPSWTPSAGARRKTRRIPSDTQIQIDGSPQPTGIMILPEMNDSNKEDENR